MGAQMFLDEYEVGKSWVHNPVSCSPVTNTITQCNLCLLPHTCKYHSNMFLGGAIRSTEVPNRPV